MQLPPVTQRTVSLSFSALFLGYLHPANEKINMHLARSLLVASSLALLLAALGSPADYEVQLAALAAGFCGGLALERPAAVWSADGFPCWAPAAGMSFTSN